MFCLKYIVFCSCGFFKIVDTLQNRHLPFLKLQQYINNIYINYKYKRYMASLEETPRQSQGGGGIISPILSWNVVVFSLIGWGRWLRGGWSWHPFWHRCPHNQDFDTQSKMEEKQRCDLMRSQLSKCPYLSSSGKQQWSGFCAFFTGVAGLSTTALPFGWLWQVAAQTFSVLSHNKLTQALITGSRARDGLHADAPQCLTSYFFSCWISIVRGVKSGKADRAHWINMVDLARNMNLRTS